MNAVKPVLLFLYCANTHDPTKELRKINKSWNKKKRCFRCHMMLQECWCSYCTSISGATDHLVVVAWRRSEWFRNDIWNNAVWKCWWLRQPVHPFVNSASLSYMIFVPFAISQTKNLCKRMTSNVIYLLRNKTLNKNIIQIW